MEKFPNRKYQIIYADPPWEYKKSIGIRNTARGLAKKYYPTMPLEEIENLPLEIISDKNCYLFMWTTAPLIRSSLKVLECWGFKFSMICFTWIKMNKKSDSLFWGMGNATRANPEYVLLGKRGKLKRVRADIHSVLISRIQEHSKKPDEIRNRIVALYGDLPRIELFARHQVNGWDSWGNEV